MLELGDESEQSHRQIGKVLADMQIDIFISVGKRMHWAVDEYVRRTSRPKTAGEFPSPMQAGITIQNLLKEGDVVLVKGSQGMRMEKIVEELMAEPNRKEKLLIRQDEVWRNQDIQPSLVRCFSAS